MSDPFETPRASAPQDRRIVPYHCPYCGEEDLRPHEATHGTWECHACLRAFSVKFIGQLRPASARSESDA